MKSQVRPVGFSVLVAIAVSSACSSQKPLLPTIGKPDQEAISVDRTFRFALSDVDGGEIGLRDIADAIAEAYTRTSRFGEMRYRGVGSAYTEFGKEGVRSGPATGSLGSGVTAISTPSQVRIEYRVERSNSSGRGETVTSTVLNVGKVGGKEGEYRVVGTTVSENRGVHPGLGILALDAVAPIGQIKRDIESTVANMEPRVRRVHSQIDEFDVPYSPAAVFANFERKLRRQGESVKPSQEPHEGLFKIPDLVPALTVKVIVYPYRNQSKVKTSFSVPYEIGERDVNTYPVETVRAMTARLRQIAND